MVGRNLFASTSVKREFQVTLCSLDVSVVDFRLAISMEVFTRSSLMLVSEVEIIARIDSLW